MTIKFSSEQTQNLIPCTVRGIVTICRTPVGWGKTFPTFITGVGWMFLMASTTALPLEKGHFPAENKRHTRLVRGGTNASLHQTKRVTLERLFQNSLLNSLCSRLTGRKGNHLFYFFPLSPFSAPSRKLTCLQLSI